jgi:hypothetical protein
MKENNDRRFGARRDVAGLVQQKWISRLVLDFFEDRVLAPTPKRKPSQKDKPSYP